MGPQARLAQDVAPQDFRPGPQRGVGVQDPGGEALEELGFVARDAQVPQRALRVREGQREGARGGAGIVILVGHRQRAIPAYGHPRREGQAQETTGGQTDALSQADDRVQHGPRGAREGPPVEGHRILGAAAAAQEPPAVGLPFHRPLHPPLHAQHVDRPHAGLLPGAGSSGADKGGALWQVLGLDEELAEDGMGQVFGDRGQGDLGVARDLELARPVALVGHGQAAHLDVVLGGDRDVELRRDVLLKAAKDGPLGSEGDQIILGLAVRGMVGRGPDRPGAHVPQVEELTSQVTGRVLAVPGDGAATAQAGPASRVGDDGGVGAVGQELRVRESGVGRPEAPDRHRGDRSRHPRLLGGSELRDGSMARHALLQQQRGGLHAGIGVEALHHWIAEDGVGQRDQAHPLVMGQECLDDGPACAMGPGLANALAFVRLPVSVINGLVETVRAVQPFPGQAPEVVCGPLGVHHGGQGGGVGGHHQLVAEASLQPQAGDAEGFVLVRPVAVRDVKGGLRDPPGHALLSPVFHLPPYGHAARLVEEGPRVAPHHEEGHEVFEEAGVPRQERGGAVHAGQQPPQVEPVAVGDVALGDGDETGQAGLGSQKVVVGRFEPAWALGVCEAIAEGEDLALPLVEEVEAHAVDESEGARGELLEARREHTGLRGRGRQPRGEGPRPVGGLDVMAGGRTSRLEQCDRFGQRGDQSAGTRQLLLPVRWTIQLAQYGRHRCGQGGPPFLVRGWRVRQTRQAPPGHFRGVGQAVADLRRGLGLAGQPPQAVGQRQESARKVAAIHGGDVAGRQRRQGPRVVPVKQMAFEALQFLHGGQRGLEPPDQLGGADEAEVVGGQGREEPHPDVRGGRPVGDHQPGRFLEVVRRQVVVLGAHEGLEVAPGLACDETEEASILGAKEMTLGRHGLAEPVGHQRRGHPQGQEGTGHSEAARLGGCDQGEEDQGEEGAGRHPCEEQQRAGPGAEAGGPGGGGGRRLPLEEAALRDHEANQGETDGVGHLVGLVGEERDLQERLGAGGLRVLAQNPQEHPQGLLGGGAGAEPDGQRV